MKLHEEWLLRAFHDLESAEIIFNSGKQLFDICAYHTQQCAEKALKAFLAYHNQEIDKVHNLVYLISQCKKINKDLIVLENEAVFLNPFSTQFRYPEGDLFPSRDETKTAISYAEKIYNVIKDLLNA